jgi:hypothetical protein
MIETGTINFQHHEAQYRKYKNQAHDAEQDFFAQFQLAEFHEVRPPAVPVIQKNKTRALCCARVRGLFLKLRTHQLRRQPRNY